MRTEFSGDQFEDAYPDGIEDGWWSLARGRIVARAVRSFAGSDAAVLEVGCGRGIVVASLREAGLDCRGVELADVRPIHEKVAEHLRTGVDAADLPAAERQRYDTLLLLDVIEHVEDPAAFLRQLTGAFANVSRVLVTVPARPELWSNYDEYYGHFRRYTPEMLDALAGEIGWSLRRTSYFFHAVYLPAWLVVKTGRQRRTRLLPPAAWSRPLHRWIGRAMDLEAVLLPGGLPGTSVLGCFTLPG